MIRSNYDTLTLKLQENLDHYEKYSEKPKEAAFFTQLVRVMVVSSMSKVPSELRYLEHYQGYNSGAVFGFNWKVSSLFRLLATEKKKDPASNRD